jgi:flagellar hook protein FlgE
MFGAIYVGLSGLNAYSRGLQQVSNNVTNLNTQGFKASTVSFTDVFGAQGNGGLSFSSGQGSPGHGVENGTSQIDLAAGELRQTDRDLDLAVDGSGFLTLMRGSEIAYTRTGSFEVDKDGYIVLSGTQYRLATIDGAGRPVAVTVDASRTSPPVATTKVTLADNLAADGATDPATNQPKPVSISNILVYDQSGTQHTWTAQFAKDPSAAHQWLVTVKDSIGKDIGTAQVLKFDAGGHIDPTTTTLAFTDSDAALSVNFDLSAVTSFSSAGISTLRSASVDGYGPGTITTVTINEAGQLELGYSNSQKKQLGAIAIADFRDPQELKQRSGGLFTDNGNAGREILPSGDPRVGKVVSRRLEASNVDLSKEFGDLILIQRGFQASSQIISVANDMIQQLFGIRGQGG